MTHIELIGPAGVGKSTIYRNLMEKNEFHFGIREYLNKSDSKYNSEIRKFQNKLLNNAMRAFWKISYRFYYKKFNLENREYKKFCNEILRTLERDRKMIKKDMINTASEYEFGMSQKKNDEIYIMDEGFCHLLFKLYVRLEKFKFEIAECLEFIRIPDILIKLTAPPTIVNRRRKKRGSKTKPISEIRDDLNQIDTICESINHHGTEVIQISNTSDINSVQNNIIKCIHSSLGDR